MRRNIAPVFVERPGQPLAIDKEIVELFVQRALHVIANVVLISLAGKNAPIQFLLEPLRTLALYETDRVPELDFSGEARAAARRRLRALGLRGRPVAVHPGSGSPAKNWPAARFLEILRHLRTGGHEAVVVLGEADAAEAAVLARELPELPVLAGLTLVDLGAALAECRAFLGNDSGIAHLAAAAGLPVVVLFGPSDPETWAPRGRGGVTVLSAPERELERLEAAAVREALARILN